MNECGAFHFPFPRRVAGRRQQGACHAGNEFRAGDAANWDNFLDIALGPHPTPGNVKTAGLIRASIHKRDAPRACSSILPWG